MNDDYAEQISTLEAIEQKMPGRYVSIPVAELLEMTRKAAELAEVKASRERLQRVAIAASEGEPGWLGTGALEEALRHLEPGDLAVPVEPRS